MGINTHHQCDMTRNITLNLRDTLDLNLTDNA